MDRFLAFIMRLVIFFPGTIGIVLLLILLVYNDSNSQPYNLWLCQL